MVFRTSHSPGSLSSSLAASFHFPLMLYSHVSFLIMVECPELSSWISSLLYLNSFTLVVSSNLMSLNIIYMLMNSTLYFRTASFPRAPNSYIQMLNHHLYLDIKAFLNWMHLNQAPHLSLPTLYFPVFSNLANGNFTHSVAQFKTISVISDFYHSLTHHI